MVAISSLVLLFGACAVVSGNPVASAEEGGAEGGDNAPAPAEVKLITNEWEEFTTPKHMLSPKIKLRKNKDMKNRLEICVPEKSQWVKIGGQTSKGLARLLKKQTMLMYEKILKRVNSQLEKPTFSTTFMFNKNEDLADGVTKKKSVFLKVPDDVTVDNSYLSCDGAKCIGSLAVLQPTCFFVSSGKPSKSFLIPVNLLVKEISMRSGGKKNRFSVFEEMDEFCNCDD